MSNTYTSLDWDRLICWKEKAPSIFVMYVQHIHSTCSSLQTTALKRRFTWINILQFNPHLIKNVSPTSPLILNDTMPLKVTHSAFPAFSLNHPEDPFFFTSKLYKVPKLIPGGAFFSWNFLSSWNGSLKLHQDFTDFVMSQMTPALSWTSLVHVYSTKKKRASGLITTTNVQRSHWPIRVH